MGFYRLIILNKKNILTKITKVIIMFHLTCISWIFFRSETIEEAFHFFKMIIFQFQFSNQSITLFMVIIFFILPNFMYELKELKNGYKNFRNRNNYINIIFINYCFFMIILFQAPSHKDFIYFQF